MKILDNLLKNYIFKNQKKFDNLEKNISILKKKVIIRKNKIFKKKNFLNEFKKIQIENELFHLIGGYNFFKNYYSVRRYIYLRYLNWISLMSYDKKNLIINYFFVWVIFFFFFLKKIILLINFF